jgi:aldose 1-epimerase
MSFRADTSARGIVPRMPSRSLAPARTVLRSDGRGLPIGTAIVEDTEYDFRQSRPIGSTTLDHAFTDLERDGDGLARVTLRDPDHGTEVSLGVDESHPYLMLFTGDPLPDVRRRSLAVEPMTCPPNAFRIGDALIRLEPGASFRPRARARALASLCASSLGC